MVREQFLHVFFAALTFSFIAAVAVGLDLASIWIGTLGVSEFTKGVIYYASHALLAVDIALFALYLLKTSIDLIRGLFS